MNDKQVMVKVPQLSKNQWEILNKKTPAGYIKTKPGRGGTQVVYVAVSYIIQTLNEAFGPAWDWEILEQEVGKEQVWVKGRLTVWFKAQYKFVKTSFGGADIKVYSKGHPREGQSIDIADDLKAASADALKKCASMMGVAADIYFPKLEESEGSTYP